ncbi:hypothetical protein KZ770_18655 [Escherichia coli]|nr:hypothetical protein [Escherichia coli]
MVRGESPLCGGASSQTFLSEVCLRGTSRLGLFHREAPGATSLTVLLFFMPVRPSRLFFARIIFIENWQLRESSKLKKAATRAITNTFFAFFSSAGLHKKDSLSGSGYTQVILG